MKFTERVNWSDEKFDNQSEQAPSYSHRPYPL